ncbi:putative GTP-binding protein 6 [Hyperolius riggenbachi]|uniref:putative GTP-binding protein 6 n=1 Tax=Hyperolius riggenbachi TaxID=752182 RepID=UPI0035A39915
MQSGAAPSLTTTSFLCDQKELYGLCAMLSRWLWRAVRASPSVIIPSRVPRCHGHLMPLMARDRLHVPRSRTVWSSTPCWQDRPPGYWDGNEREDWIAMEEEDLLGDEEDDDENELLVSQAPTLQGAQYIIIVQPDVKWGPSKPRDTTADLMLSEAIALVRSVPDWVVVNSLIVSTKTPNNKYIFGKGNLQYLTEQIKYYPHATAIFLNVERISSSTEKVLEAEWGTKVFDRYTVVLNIFRLTARTREAKLQIALAEIPLLRSNLKNETAHLDQQGGGSRYIMGSGETFLEVQQRLLKEREQRIKKALEKLRKKRKLIRSQRKKREFPIISVIGYTNSGKTTLIKALTNDPRLQPRDQLFATLDVTAHGGLLPFRLPVIYVDTIGFLSQLPHNLIESFSATLEDIIHSDLLIHVRDLSHPEYVNQKKSVLAVLSGLNIPQRLLDSMIEVHNKTDIVPNRESDEGGFRVSALIGSGLEELKKRIETAVLESTGRIITAIRVNLESPQLSWLYKEATVLEVNVLPEDGSADVVVIITSAAYGKYKKLFDT